MANREAPANPPMGRLDAYDVGPKKLTIQTEFFPRPDWRIETKVYLGGALKKVYTEDLSTATEEDLQKTVDRYHEARREEIINSIRAKKAQAEA